MELGRNYGIEIFVLRSKLSTPEIGNYHEYVECIFTVKKMCIFTYDIVRQIHDHETKHESRQL